VIKPENLDRRPSKLMKIPNADFLERTKSEILGARVWRVPPKSANTLHKHPKAEEFYFVVEGTGGCESAMRQSLFRKTAACSSRPKLLRQVFNDTDEEVLLLIVGARQRIRARRTTRHEGVLSGRSETVAERVRWHEVATRRELRVLRS
jgi:mannose-6-phosphate isomerase-like protein (cupin superfamily)